MTDPHPGEQSAPEQPGAGRTTEPRELAGAELQLDWDVGNLENAWPTWLDTRYLMYRVGVEPSEVTARAEGGRVLEVAAAEAIHSCKLNLKGMESFVVEPSLAMLDRAKQRIAEYGARVTLIRGICETLPLADQTFDRVLIDSAMDHLANPELSAREMTRVLKPDGRLVITFVNYGGFSARASRLLYRIARRAHLPGAAGHFSWDSPVPVEHTFECTFPRMHRICDPHLVLDHAFGISLLWGFPGWGRFLGLFPERFGLGVVYLLDRLAYRLPSMSDFVVAVWRPRPPASTSAHARPSSEAGPASEFAVQPTDVVYPGKAQVEADYWGQYQFGSGCFALTPPRDRRVNQAYTGDPERSWIEDLLSRGPFERAAVLGCDEGGWERLWLHRGGSERLDVYELSPGVIRKVREGLGLGWWEANGPRRRVRFIRADLNFARLPAERYDVVWSSGCLHHIVNLEHLFAEVERSLRPGGLFALRDFVGERRMRFAPERLARINSLIREVPPRWRRIDAVEPPRLDTLSPFCAVRSNEIVALAKARFDVVREGYAGALFPLVLRRRHDGDRTRGAGSRRPSRRRRSGGGARGRSALRRLRGVPQARLTRHRSAAAASRAPIFDRIGSRARPTACAMRAWPSAVGCSESKKSSGGNRSCRSRYERPRARVSSAIHCTKLCRAAFVKRML